MKKKKYTLELPIYDVSTQVAYITRICDHMDFDVNRLVSFILADWICTFQEGLRKGLDTSQVFLTYLNSVSRTCQKIEKLKKEVNNAGKSNPESTDTPVSK